MRYAIFTDVHANLEALEAVLAKIDELAQEEPIDKIWFLGDLVGYGPNPNECIRRLRECTDIIIAGNHDWAAVGKIDLEDFSAAARISAEWTAEQLSEEHREFLAQLPERLEIGECTLVHGSPYGPLWEYLTSETLAERSFQYFTSRFCLVGHTHVPVIFQQPDIANTPTLPLVDGATYEIAHTHINGINGTHGTAPDDEAENEDEDEEATSRETVELVHAIQAKIDRQQAELEHLSAVPVASSTESAMESKEMREPRVQEVSTASTSHDPATEEDDPAPKAEDEDVSDPTEAGEIVEISAADLLKHASHLSDEEREEIEELLTLLGLNQNMTPVTNEMVVPPEGDWQAPIGYRAIINPGGVGQPRDGDPRAAFMIYDTERGFTFYRIPYDFEKTQEKIVESGLPPYLAARLAFGR
jgi:diadenosine tetraphosphatase ApaH/serine/threonine PP2A family protein phosphatase